MTTLEIADVLCAKAIAGTLTETELTDFVGTANASDEAARAVRLRSHGSPAARTALANLIMDYASGLGV